MTDRYDDWVHVVPGPGELKAVAKALLTIAPSVHHVRTESNGTEFLVHPAVAETYQAGLDAAPATAPKRARKKVVKKVHFRSKKAAPKPPAENPFAGEPAAETEGNDHAH